MNEATLEGVSKKIPASLERKNENDDKIKLLFQFQAFSGFHFPYDTCMENLQHILCTF